jgi:hypothetical protein
VTILPILQIPPRTDFATKEALMVPTEPLIGKKLITEFGVTLLISLDGIGKHGDIQNNLTIAILIYIVMMVIIIIVLE